MASNAKSNNDHKKIDFPDLELLLRKSLRCEQLEVIEYSATSLVPPGENYGSIAVKLEATIRRNTDAKEEQLHLVAKTMPKVERPIIDWPVILKKEMFVYLELMPAYRDIEREAGMAGSELIDLVPKYFGYQYSLSENSEEVDEQSVLLLENITTQGFYKYDKKKVVSSGVDLDHVKKALSALARYHALGIALRHKRPDFFEKALAHANVVGIDVDILEQNLSASLKDFIENPSIAGGYLPIIKASYEAFINSFKKLPTLEDNIWSTITHGDFGVHNMMFHDDDQGNVDDVKFFDFQIYFFGSALSDLLLFVVCGLHSDTFDYHIDEVLNIYYKDFIKTLERVGIDTKIYTKSSFDAEITKQAFVRFPFCVVFQKFLTFEVPEELDNDLLSTVYQSKCSEVFKDRLRKLFLIYERRGWFSQ